MKKKKGKIYIEVTRKQAMEHGLLVCECGYPKNNHFDWGKKFCAHTLYCKGYKEVSKVGKLI